MCKVSVTVFLHLHQLHSRKFRSIGKVSDTHSNLSVRDPVGRFDLIGDPLRQDRRRTGAHVGDRLRQVADAVDNFPPGIVRPLKYRARLIGGKRKHGGKR